MIQPLGINNHLNPVTAQWARHAINDPALFQGILFHASVHLKLHQGESWERTILTHRGETIRLLSERLKDSDELVSDETIAAVGWLGSEGVGHQSHYQVVGKLLTNK
jgi:Fungal specific transcription factor domain